MNDDAVHRIHGSKLIEKMRSNPNDDGLQRIHKVYEEWKTASQEIQGRASSDVALLVEMLNRYKDQAEPVLDARSNSAQEVLQPSILEEFMGILFEPLATRAETAVMRPERGYLSLVFHPRDLATLDSAPDFTVSRKDHDFVIGASADLAITGGSGVPLSERIVIPAVAIECKRYLERNMLDECSGTAARLKKATPYCLYLVVSEYLKMNDAHPEISRIDEIFILRKQRNSDRNSANFIPHPIDAYLVYDLYCLVKKHLNRIWWDPQSAVTTGKVFGF